ncbi:MAG: hypothetical protein KH373_03970 [Ruminococcus sp.]|nr:hypothetical protein [Ruminococcus sp.]
MTSKIVENFSTFLGAYLCDLNTKTKSFPQVFHKKVLKTKSFQLFHLTSACQVVATCKPTIQVGFKVENFQQFKGRKRVDFLLDKCFASGNVENFCGKHFFNTKMLKTF